jgi:hypothetical protein
MSNRFHNKYHRHNHHTDRINDPRYPDASHDPIASPDYPFLGNFVMYGNLSATQNELSAFAGSFVNVGAGPGGMGINIQTDSGLAIQAVGDANITGTLSAGYIEFTGIESSQTFTNPITATGDFLTLKVNGKYWAVRLWDYNKLGDPGA